MTFWRRTLRTTGQPARVLARGERTVVREFDRTDVDRWIEWPPHADPLFHTYNAPYLSTRQRDLYYQQRRTCPDGRQYAVDDLQGELVGRISLRDIDWPARCAVLGVSFRPGRLNQGLGTDGLRCFCRYYFNVLELQILLLDVAAFNERACRVYEKCGFRRTGQRWGDPQADPAGIFVKREFEAIRPLFRWDYGLVRPLLYDMELHVDAWERSERLHEHPTSETKTRMEC